MVGISLFHSTPINESRIESPMASSIEATSGQRVAVHRTDEIT
jgi:hypothetical protein